MDAELVDLNLRRPIHYIIGRHNYPFKQSVVIPKPFETYSWEVCVFADSRPSEFDENRSAIAVNF